MVDVLTITYLNQYISLVKVYVNSTFACDGQTCNQSFLGMNKHESYIQDDNGNNRKKTKERNENKNREYNVDGPGSCISHSPKA